VGKDGLDASIGLAFSLELFKRYSQSGVLQAEISRIPGIHGRCTACLTLVEGEISSIYLEDKQKQRYSSDKDTLCRLDKERGPFEWRFFPLNPDSSHSLSTSKTSPLVPDPLAHALQRVSIPRVIAPFPWERVTGWTAQQRDALYSLLISINGMRTIEQLKMLVPLPPELIDELLHILLDLNVITITQS
jgi:hypothetical protein